jgi:hypothetical protein
MPIGQLGSQLIGQYNSALLLPSTAVAAGTYHFAEQPVTGASSGTTPGIVTVSGPYALKTGAPTGSGDVLYSAGKYLSLVVSITNINAGTLTVTIYGADAASNTVYLILASTALAANAVTVLRVGPTYTVAANLVAQDIIPLTWNVQVATTTTITFSLGAYQGA